MYRMSSSVLTTALLAWILLVAGCSSAPKYGQQGTKQRYQKTGVASYYAHRFHGRQTASGETFDMYAMTAAHKKLKFGTRVRVTNTANGKSVVVRINDRGPFAKKRIIDLSYAAAKRLDMLTSGTAKVRLKILY